MSDQTIFGRSTGSHHVGMEVGQDVMVNERFIGGPHTGKDIRMYISREVLEQMLVVAKSSGTGRVVLNNCGIRVSDWRQKSGHMYEVWSFFSAKPTVEKGTPYERMISQQKRHK